MTAEQGLAYAGYLLWLVAGAVDFGCHRRGGLALTSGWRECALHFVQLGLIAAGLGLWLLLAPGLALSAALVAIVCAHAAVGYADTAVASRRRPVRPLEQHVHSVLDMAPWVGTTWYLAISWDRAVASGWVIAPRDPPVTAAWWLALLLPALVLVGWPAVREMAAVADVRRVSGSGL